jgi:hypothetical protein
LTVFEECFLRPEITAVFGGLFGILAITAVVLIIPRFLKSLWDPLYSRFPSVNGAPKEEMKFESMTIRLKPFLYLNFAFCTALKITTQSIHIRIQFQLMKLFHSIDLPWSALQSVELKYSFFGRPCALVRIHGYTPVAIFRSKPAQLIYDIWNRQKTNA